MESPMTSQLLLCREHSDTPEYIEIGVICEKCSLSYCMPCAVEKFDAVCKCGEEFTTYENENPEIKYVKNLKFSYCENHPDYQAVYYCKGSDLNKCKAILCPACINEDEHKNHETVLIQDEVKSSLSSVNKTKGEINKTIEKIDEYISKLKEDQKNVTTYYDDLKDNIKEDKQTMAEIIKVCKEEKKKQLDDLTLGKLPEIKEYMKARIKEFKSRQDLIEEFNRFISGMKYLFNLTVKNFRALVPLITEKPFTKEDNMFIKELEEKLEYPKGTYTIVNINQSMDTDQFEKAFDIVEVNVKKTSKIIISGYDFK